MNKRTLTIISLLSIIFLVVLLIIRTTYSVIIDVTESDNKYEPTKRITISDLITDEYGGYNNVYYNVVTELNITIEDANILINSNELNDALNILINNVIENKYNHQRKLTNREITNLIITAVNNDNLINNELKAKVIAKTNSYINEISNYLYSLKTIYK